MLYSHETSFWSWMSHNAFSELDFSSLGSRARSHFLCLYGHIHFLCKSALVDILYTVDTGFENRYHNTLMKKISMHKDRKLLVPLGKLLTLTERNVA